MVTAINVWGQLLSTCPGEILTKYCCYLLQLEDRRTRRWSSMFSDRKQHISSVSWLTSATHDCMAASSSASLFEALFNSWQCHTQHYFNNHNHNACNDSNHISIYMYKSHTTRQIFIYSCKHEISENVQMNVNSEWLIWLTKFTENMTKYRLPKWQRHSTNHTSSATTSFSSVVNSLPVNDFISLSNFTFSWKISTDWKSYCRTLVHSCNLKVSTTEMILVVH